MEDAATQLLSLCNTVMAKVDRCRDGDSLNVLLQTSLKDVMEDKAARVPMDGWSPIVTKFVVTFTAHQLPMVCISLAKEFASKAYSKDASINAKLNPKVSEELIFAFAT